MATRDDMLVELGLTPTWRRRHAGTAPPEVVASVAVERAASHPAAPPSTEVREAGPRTVAVRVVAPDEAARAARIAALSWDEFASDVDACTACGLCRTRNRSVPGVGDVNAEWLFVGEAPGADEDARGEPFVGQAGRLLDNMLAALGMARGRNVYIANVLKCRPPNNRTPDPAEAEACRPYLERQVALLHPKLIVALGKSAASLLLGTDATIASLRGRVHRYRGAPLIVTYHPAYLLRNLPDKAKAWEDMVLARRTVAANPDHSAADTPPVAH
jgi:uracil-DNA glycosylase family 4